MQNPREKHLRRETAVPVYLTITEVAAHLGMSRTHIMRLEEKPGLNFPKHRKLVGNRRHYREDELLAWIREREIAHEVERRGAIAAA